MNVIQCYAPTSGNKDEDIDQSFQRLQSIAQKCPGNDMTVLTGDLNARAGIDITGYQDIMGRHELTRRKEREW
ncbi:unnamed protein product [Schistosoma margrebowiei]|uniref:Uncharacterized protein n=1 Tax=Schistosoma margrebowiei TaxID=48269 RepID=A0A183M0D4_9TREM|nr:unnamed protein product [Schistosoma margrebowiei]